jgi:hypothetical protein
VFLGCVFCHRFAARSSIFSPQGRACFSFCFQPGEKSAHYCCILLPEVFLLCSRGQASRSSFSCSFSNPAQAVLSLVAWPMDFIGATEDPSFCTEIFFPDFILRQPIPFSLRQCPIQLEAFPEGFFLLPLLSGEGVGAGLFSFLTAQISARFLLRSSVFLPCCLHFCQRHSILQKLPLVPVAQPRFLLECHCSSSKVSVFPSSARLELRSRFR